MKGFKTIPNEVFADKNLSGAAKILYTHIIDLSKRKGYCYAKNKWLAAFHNMNEKKMRRLIAELKTTMYPGAVENEFYIKCTGTNMNRRMYPWSPGQK